MSSKVFVPEGIPNKDLIDFLVAMARPVTRYIEHADGVTIEFPLRADQQSRVFAKASARGLTPGGRPTGTREPEKQPEPEVLEPVAVEDPDVVVSWPVAKIRQYVSDYEEVLGEEWMQAVFDAEQERESPRSTILDLVG